MFLFPVGYLENVKKLLHYNTPNMQHSEMVTLENLAPRSCTVLAVTHQLPARRLCDNEILGPVGQVLQVEGYPVLGSSVKEQAVTTKATATHARPRTSSPVAGSSRKDVVPVSRSRLLWVESNAHHGPGPCLPTGQGGAPSSPRRWWHLRGRGSWLCVPMARVWWRMSMRGGEGRGGGWPSYVVEAEEVIAGEDAKRCHAVVAAAPAGPGTAAPEVLPLPKGPFCHGEAAAEAEHSRPSGTPATAGCTKQRQRRACSWVKALTAAGRQLARLSPPAVE